ncbi:D-alanyl-D-alanine carboxypeptidase family protein [Frisingicoccus sp.]|uniref:D-alanyl-D-alanine carboxypeptidase family protein n=1 Tax=Frisingicoccus sp. TaxID=1918627 RepID=UPI002EC2F637|nr:serine hydrolase [Frisingicoccus sp.]
MKKLGMAFLCFCTAGLLMGCSSSSDLMKSYNDTALENSRRIINMNQNSDYDFFAVNLALFPKNTNSINIEETESSEETDDLVPETSGEIMASSQEDISNTSLLASIDRAEGVYGKDVYDRVYPASVTKIMTALLTIQHANFTDKVIFTEDMVVTDYGAKLCGFNVGDELTVEQLFQGLMIYSGNDAANALAIHIGGSIENFADMMNKEAKRLGCVDTNFVNPSGLHDNNHYTSAYDLYLIFNECLKYEDFTNVIRQRSCDISYTNAQGEIVDATYTTTNQYFLDTYDYPENVRVLGGKTGTTDEAGCCLILYDVDSKDSGYISVVLGASTSQELYSEMNVLLNKIPK